eukprot:m.111905 g.111905  ORF g.111905 m.111905 type:complete len:168 (-) comp9099_c0_seq3:80-583(-)
MHATDASSFCTRGTFGAAAMGQAATMSPCTHTLSSLFLFRYLYLDLYLFCPVQHSHQAYQRVINNISQEKACHIRVASRRAAHLFQIPELLAPTSVSPQDIADIDLEDSPRPSQDMMPGSAAASPYALGKDAASKLELEPRDSGAIDGIAVDESTEDPAEPGVESTV